MAERTALAPVAALALVAMFWGAIPLFVRNDVSAIGLVGVRVTLGAVALVVVAASVRKLRWSHGRWGRVALAGVLLAAHWITFFESLKHAPVAVTLAILYLGPIAASILARPFLGEVVPPRVWIALGVATVGMVLVVQPWSVDNAVTARGVGMAALSAALLTVLLLSGKPIAQQLGGLTMATGELIIASVLLAPATYDALTSYPDQIWNFLILGALLTGIAGFVYWEVMRRISMASVSVIMYIEPASAVIWAAIFLDEHPNPTSWLGVAGVVAGGIIAATNTRQREAVLASANL